LYQKTTLDNGLRILTEAMPHTRSVSISMFIGVGSRYETDKQAGISHFIEHLLFKGTAKRPTSREISEAIEGTGGILNGGTDKEITIFWCKVAQHHFSTALDVLVDMLLNSKFDPHEIERERQVVIEEINMCRDMPSQWVDMLIDELLWYNHPLGRDVAGTRESVTTITRAMMLDYLNRRYLPDSTVVAVAGGIQHEEAVAAISQTVGNWANSKARNRFLAYKERAAPQVRIENRDTEQTQLCLGLPGLSISHPKRFILDLLNVILGEGMSSRLFAEVRDKLGLAYSISSFVDHFQDSGALTVSAGVDVKNLRPAIKAILEQLALLKETVPEPELVKAKELSKGRLLLRMEDSRSVAGWLGGQEILTGKIMSVDEVLSIIDAITAEELKQVAEELIVDDRLRLAIVGPIDEDEPLEELLKI
jgi:predicted Zn-dependent peptidase